MPYDLPSYTAWIDKQNAGFKSKMLTHGLLNVMLSHGVFLYYSLNCLPPRVLYLAKYIALNKLYCNGLFTCQFSLSDYKLLENIDILYPHLYLCHLAIYLM